VNKQKLRRAEKDRAIIVGGTAILTGWIAAALILASGWALPSIALALDVDSSYGYCQYRDWNNNGKWAYRNGSCELSDRLSVTTCLSPAFVGEGGAVAITIYDTDWGYEVNWRAKPATVLLFRMDGDCKVRYKTYLYEWAWPARLGESAYVSYALATTASSAKGGEEGIPDVSWFSVHRGCAEGAENEYGWCVDELPPKEK